MKNGNMDANTNSYQQSQLQSISRLIDEKQELESKYIQVSSKLNHLNSCMKNLNHDIRSPLGGITGMIDLLLMENKDQVNVQTHDLMMIKESAQSLLDLINGTLVARNTHDDMDDAPNIDRTLSGVINEIQRLYLPMVKSKDVSLSIRNQISEEIELPSGFFINLIQIIGNLVANAVKFTPSGGSIDVVFTQDDDDNQSMLNIAVTDNGKSMSEKQVSAFNRGEPVSRSIGTNGEKGFGIGLQHVIEMVTEDDGRIFVESEKGFGTAFSLFYLLPDMNVTLKIASRPVARNGAAKLNGSKI